MKNIIEWIGVILLGIILGWNRIGRIDPSDHVVKGEER